MRKEQISLSYRNHEFNLDVSDVNMSYIKEIVTAKGICFEYFIEDFVYESIDAIGILYNSGEYLSLQTLVDFCERYRLLTEDEKLVAEYIYNLGNAGAGYDDVIECIQKDALKSVTLYRDTNCEELVKKFVDDGYFGEISDRLRDYIDYESLAEVLRELGYDDDLTFYDNLDGHVFRTHSPVSPS